MQNNLTFPATAETYLELLRNNHVSLSDGCPIPSGTRLRSGLLALFAGRSPRARVKYIKTLLQDCCKETGVPEPQIGFSLFSRDLAYMTDSGTMTLSWRLLRQRDVPRMIKILLHEFAHLYLAGLDNYADLLRLDMQFRQTFAPSAPVLTATPVEVYATLLSCEYLNSFAAVLPDREQRALLEQIQKEQEKIKTAAALLPAMGGNIS